MRADRLISIVLLLQNYGRMTSSELADRLEVSERTIHRDMEALSAAGIPVFAERGASGGWALSEGYRTQLTGMKTEEMQSLLLAHSSPLLSDLGLGTVFHDAFQKLLASFPARLREDAELVRQRVHVDGAGWHPSDESLPDLPIVQEAVWQEKKLYMQYNREKDVVARIVEPLGLVAKSSIWYLVAAAEGELRTYRISRIRNARILEESFERPASFDLASHWEQSTQQFRDRLPQYPARLRLSAKALSRASRQRYMKLLHTGPEVNGWIEADVEFHTLDSACEILLAYGPLVKVLEPVELRDSLLTQAQGIVLLYNEENVEDRNKGDV
ncbi:YafY family protein [Paenibacillus sp. J2TS4]|uniref:helix-turn-helix transcriptional regulator n=1 Tax=Paenibacillus sp. J2TS4 TaxID=2807194 RepID=UPI001B143982|nr:YafY family protein [Paenibacillus sp. J2TS4]GIP32838.1 transcriptional regulator [Paenibacillus sp. J2TS4]